MRQANTPQEASFIKIGSDLLVDGTTKWDWLCPGLQCFPVAGSDVASPRGEDPQQCVARGAAPPGLASHPPAGTAGDAEGADTCSSRNAPLWSGWITAGQEDSR